MTTYNTGTPIGSTDARDLYNNAQTLDEIVNSSASSVTTRTGRSVLSIDGAMQLLGYEPAVAFAAGLSITRSTQSVLYSGLLYHARPDAIPFTTTGTFNAGQWTLREITAADLASTASGKGAGLAGYSWSAIPAAIDRADWGIRTASGAVSVLRYIPPAEWAAIIAGTSTTDVSAYVQAAIDAEKSIFFPAGTYKINATIYLKVGLVMHGESMRYTVLDFSACTGPCFSAQLDRYGAGYRLQGIRDSDFAYFKVVGNETAAGNHIFASDYGVHRTTWRRIWFYSCGGDAHHWNCDNAYGGFYNTVAECVFGDPSDFSTPSATTARIKGDAIWATGSCNQNVVLNNIFWRGNKNFIHLIGTTTWSIQRWTIRGNGLEGAGVFRSDAGFFAVLIEGDSLCMTICENYLEGNGLTPPYLGGGIYVNSQMCDVTIRGNLFASNPRDIWLVGTAGGNIDGNQWVTPPTYHNIKIDGIAANGYVNIGTNNCITTIANKYLDIAVSTQPRVHGDAACALRRGNTPLAGKFTPKLYGGATEISCSTAVAVYERRANKLAVRFQFVVSNLNGATGLVGIAGNDGINLPMPGYGATIQYPFKNDATELSSTRQLLMSNVTLPAGCTEAFVQANQSGAYYAYLRCQGSGVASTNLLATGLAVGSVLFAEFEVTV
jgi:hypothetical protein